MDGWMDGWMDGKPDGRMGGWLNGWMRLSAKPENKTGFSTLEKARINRQTRK